MKLLHVIHRYPPALGGSEAYFARLSRFLLSRGDQVTVCTTTALDLEAFWDPRARQLPAGQEVIDGVVVRRHRLWHLPLLHRYVFKALSLAPVPRWQALTVPFSPIVPSLWSRMAEPSETFDLIHASAFPYSFPLACARRLARRLNIPFLLTPFVHTGDPDDPRDRIRRAYTSPALIDLARSADRLFVQTEGERQVLLDRGIGSDRIVLQGLGVDLPSCTGGDRQRARQLWQVKPDEVVIGHLANNSIEKGSVDLLQAGQRAWSRGCSFTIVLAGAEMPNFRAFWQSYQAKGRVVRLGVLDERQKRDFFAAIDIFCLPSRSDSFGLVLPEAWANATPCVGYRAGGVAWVIRDEVDGVLVRCGDVEGLARALERLCAEPETRRRMGEAGGERIRVEFDWEKKLELVRRVCEEARR